MLTSSYDAMRQIQTKISESATISTFCEILKQHNLTAKVMITTPSGETITLELPTMLLDGFETFHIDVSIRSNIGELCNIELMPIPVEYALKEWERSLLGSFSHGLKEHLQKII